MNHPLLPRRSGCCWLGAAICDTLQEGDQPPPP